MKVAGFLCGVGTLLHEARLAGYEVLGNIESRRSHQLTKWLWEHNFGKLPYPTGKGDIAHLDWRGVDLAIGHPPCGGYSNLGHTGVPVDRTSDEERARRRQRRHTSRGLIPEFVSHVKRYKPKMFALENLPKMLTHAAPPEWWEQELPQYKFTFINIFNYDYGNPQRRKRLWVIASRGKRFKFIPPSKRLKGPANAWDAIKDLPWEPWKDIPEIAHVHHGVNTRVRGGFWLGNKDHRRAKYIEETVLGFFSIHPGMMWPYKTELTGRFAKKIGFSRLSIERPCRGLTGGETLRHPLSGWPLTIRERARLMGWPDDFKLNHPHKFERSSILKLTALTGKAIPSEFIRYILPQLQEHGARL